MLKFENRDLFLSLIRLGIGNGYTGYWGGRKESDQIDWNALETLAAQHGLSAVLVDGVERLPEGHRPSKEVILQWIGEVLQGESIDSLQRAVSADMAKLFHSNGIKTYILKGAIVAECYPKPSHRVSSDVDCYLLPDNGDFDAWTFGNDLIRSKGFKVNTEFYKNSSFDISGVLVENHQFLTPFRGNDKLARFEIVLESLLKQDKGLDRIDGSFLYRPPVMVSALFLIEHVYSHFLHEGLTWRHVLDWMMFIKKHKKNINWTEFDAFIDEFGFRRFYESFSRLGEYLLGEIQEPDLSKLDKKMLADVWAPLDLHETTEGWKGKVVLAGNTWRARWKYHYFSDISWIRALWIQAYGVLFDKNPKLNWAYGN